MATESGLVIRWIALVSAAFVLQVAFLNQVAPFGVHPELMLLLAISGGLVAGPERGAAVGFGAGLLLDLTLNGTLGVSALCYTLVGFAVGTLREALPGTSRMLSVLIAGASSAVGVLLYATVTQLLGARTFSDPRFGVIVAIVAIWNALLSVPVLSLCKRTEGTRTAF